MMDNIPNSNSKRGRAKPSFDEDMYTNILDLLELKISIDCLTFLWMMP